MRLIIFSSSYPYGTGEQFLENEIRRLAEHYKILIVPYYWGGSKRSRAIPHNTQSSQPLYCTKIPSPSFEQFRALPEFLKDWTDYSLFESWKQKAINWLQISAILHSTGFKEAISQIKPNDILYFYWGTGAAALIPFLRRRFGLKNHIIVRLHGSDLYLKKNGYLPLREVIFTNADAILSISQNGKDYLEKNWPVCIGKTTVNYLGVEEINGINDKGQSDVTRITTCSSVDNNKRVHFIAKCLKNTERSIEWHHFGTGPEMHRVQAELPSPNIIPHFHGQVSQGTIRSFYANNRIDLFINLSLSEGIPVSMMEALASKIPIFGTNVGGVPELIDESCGWLVPSDSSCDQIAQSLRSAIDIMSSPQGEIVRENAYQKWRTKFNFNNNIDSLLTIINNLCK